MGELASGFKLLPGLGPAAVVPRWGCGGGRRQRRVSALGHPSGFADGNPRVGSCPLPLRPFGWGASRYQPPWV